LRFFLPCFSIIAKDVLPRVMGVDRQQEADISGGRASGDPFEPYSPCGWL
jgi:hypothetical protein